MKIIQCKRKRKDHRKRHGERASSSKGVPPAPVDDEDDNAMNEAASKSWRTC